MTCLNRSAGHGFRSRHPLWWRVDARVMTQRLPEVTLKPDERWKNFFQDGPDGRPVRMSLALLQENEREWSRLLSLALPDGVRRLFATARSLYVLSWFSYEVLVVASFVAFQALEATFRQVVYPEAGDGVSFARMVKWAERDGILSAEWGEILQSGAELRNALAHPLDQTAFTPALTRSVLETTHKVASRFVAGE